MIDVRLYAELSQQGYLSTISDGSGSYEYQDHVSDISWSENLNATGFSGHSYYSATENNLVISYGGTSFDLSQNTFLDLRADTQLGLYGSSSQNSQALSFAQEQIQAAREEYGADISITFTGHSLGGFLAQIVQQQTGVGSAVVINAPGLGGIAIGSNTEDDNTHYIYSNPLEWGVLGNLVHRVGDILSNNVSYVLGAEGHFLSSIINALDPDPNNPLGLGQTPVSAEQWGAILAEGFRTGVLRIEDVAPLLGLNNEIVQNTILQAMRDSGTECFLSGTLITMSDGTTKPIEDVRADDHVQSYDDNGTLVSNRVTRTFVNHAKHVLDMHGLMVTPGHVTLCGDGVFEGRHVPMIDILRSDGALVRERGSKVRAGTNCDLGSVEDRMVQAITGDKTANDRFTIRDSGQIRFGTRFIMDDGRDISIAELVTAAGGTLTKDGLVASKGAPEGTPFHWPFTAHLPKPEDYVLQRSALHLNDVYQSGEWEAIAPQMPAPQYGEAGPTVSNHPALRDGLPPNVPLSMRYGQNGPVMNRKQRRAYDAKMRKA